MWRHQLLVLRQIIRMDSFFFFFLIANHEKKFTVSWADVLRAVVYQDIQWWFDENNWKSIPAFPIFSSTYFPMTVQFSNAFFILWSYVTVNQEGSEFFSGTHSSSY